MSAMCWAVSLIVAYPDPSKYSNFPHFIKLLIPLINGAVAWWSISLTSNSLILLFTRITINHSTFWQWNTPCMTMIYWYCALSLGDSSFQLVIIQSYILWSLSLLTQFYESSNYFLLGNIHITFIYTLLSACNCSIFCMLSTLQIHWFFVYCMMTMFTKLLHSELLICEL